MSDTCNLTIDTAEQMRDLGEWLGSRFTAGDVVVLNGELGAGKTTLTQGIGKGMGVQEPITSPTFVIARQHVIPKADPALALLHIDAYRLGSAAELDDLGTDWDSSVAVIEWGAGIVDDFAFTPLFLDIRANDADVRTITVQSPHDRWSPLITELRETSWAS